jgi:hypothetical protein
MSAGIGNSATRDKPQMVHADTGMEPCPDLGNFPCLD